MPAKSHAEFTVVESVYQDDGGAPVAARVSDLGAGPETVKVTAMVSDVKNAVRERTFDDYPSVHLQSDGERLFVTDHEKALGSSDVPATAEFERDVVREHAINRPEGTVTALFSREALCAALDEFDPAETIEILLADEQPVYMTNGEAAVGIAPIVAPEDRPSSRGSE